MSLILDKFVFQIPGHIEQNDNNANLNIYFFLLLMTVALQLSSSSMIDYCPSMTSTPTCLMMSCFSLYVLFVSMFLLRKRCTCLSMWAYKPYAPVPSSSARLRKRGNKDGRTKTPSLHTARNMMQPRKFLFCLYRISRRLSSLSS